MSPEESAGAFRAARYFTSLLYVLVDHLLHNQPKQMVHVFYALFLHVLYVIFEAVYVLAGGTTPGGSTVIDGLDWSRPETAGFVSLSLLLVVGAHAGLWLLVRLRQLIYSCVSADNVIKLPLTATQAGQQPPVPPYGTAGHTAPTATVSSRPADRSERAFHMDFQLRKQFCSLTGAVSEVGVLRNPILSGFPPVSKNGGEHLRRFGTPENVSFPHWVCKFLSPGSPK